MQLKTLRWRVKQLLKCLKEKETLSSWCCSLLLDTLAPQPFYYISRKYEALPSYSLSSRKNRRRHAFSSSLIRTFPGTKKLESKIRHLLDETEELRDALSHRKHQKRDHKHKRKSKLFDGNRAPVAFETISSPTHTATLHEVSELSLNFVKIMNLDITNNILKKVVVAS